MRSVCLCGSGLCCQFACSARKALACARQTTHIVGCRNSATETTVTYVSERAAETCSYGVAAANLRLQQRPREVLAAHLVDDGLRQRRPRPPAGAAERLGLRIGQRAAVRDEWQLLLLLGAARHRCGALPHRPAIYRRSAILLCTSAAAKLQYAKSKAVRLRRLLSRS